MERIKKYQEDLRKRKEEEERIQAEEDFLRTSLRGSKKLQELEETRIHPHPHHHGVMAPSGIDNPNYLTEEEEGIPMGNLKIATLPMRTVNYEGLVQQPLGE